MEALAWQDFIFDEGACFLHKNTTSLHYSQPETCFKQKNTCFTHSTSQKQFEIVVQNCNIIVKQILFHDIITSCKGDR